MLKASGTIRNRNWDEQGEQFRGVWAGEFVGEAAIYLLVCGCRKGLRAASHSVQLAQERGDTQGHLLKGMVPTGWGTGTGEPWGQGRTLSWAVGSSTICNIPGQALVVPYRKCYRRCGCTPREPTSPAAPEGFCLILTCGCLLGCWVRVAVLSEVVGYRRHVAVPPFLTMERYFWEREEKYSSWFVLC